MKTLIAFLVLASAQNVYAGATLREQSFSQTATVVGGKSISVKLGAAADPETSGSTRAGAIARFNANGYALDIGEASSGAAPFFIQASNVSNLSDNLGVNINPNGGAVAIGGGGTPLTVISTVSYTPTLVNSTNVAGSTPRATACVRIGNIVQCAGTLDVDVTAGGLFDLTMSLPVASDLTNNFDLGGTAIANNGAADLASIWAETTGDTARILGTAATITNSQYSFTFQYIVK